MMKDRLGPLCFLPPATGTQWTGPPQEQHRYEMKRSDGSSVPLESPLFWNSPDWYQTDADTADMVASAVACEGVLVSALKKDLEAPDEPVALLEKQTADSPSNSQSEYLPRIVPYRPERYGFSAEDFDGARIIDVRLRVCGDWSGRFAYSAGQIDRWEGDPDGDPPAGGSWAPAATFPPDVVSIDHLAAKFAQLHVLSPDAAIFVSITPHRMDAEIPKLLTTKPDGIILDLSELPLSGMELGQLTRHARRLLAAANAPGLPLWIIPGEITADDAVKLVVLGATGIAIDHWCLDLIEAAEETVRTSPAARLGHGSQRELDSPLVHDTIRESLSLDLERFKGLLHRMRCLPAGQRLGSLDREWARAFEVPWVSIGRGQSNPPSQQNTEDS
jgi:hypothetical protein